MVEPRIPMVKPRILVVKGTTIFLWNFPPTYSNLSSIQLSSKRNWLELLLRHSTTSHVESLVKWKFLSMVTNTRYCIPTIMFRFLCQVILATGIKCFRSGRWGCTKHSSLKIEDQAYETKPRGGSIGKQLYASWRIIQKVTQNTYLKRDSQSERFPHSRIQGTMVHHFTHKNNSKCLHKWYSQSTKYLW